jgi:uncharacterized protein (TIGR00255 family)
MARSMTGVGTALATWAGGSVSVELRSVNARVADVKLRLGRELAHLETAALQRIQARIPRGRVEATLAARVDAATAPRLTIDVDAARAIADEARRLAAAIEAEPRDLFGLVWSSPGVVLGGTPPPPPELDAAALGALDRALAELEAARGREGVALVGALCDAIHAIEAQLVLIRAELPRLADERRARLGQRLAELTGQGAADPSRLAQELALLADRADVSEELVRLEAHGVELRRLLTLDEPVGRRIDFLVQELLREVNTLASKSASVRVSHAAIELKSLLERVREQAQNLE